MEPNLPFYRFSNHFNRLTYLGMWRPELPNPVPILMQWGYRLAATIVLLATMTLQATDLYFVLWNFRKIAYNFCTSIIVIGLSIKISLFHRRKNLLYELRIGLWKDSLKNNTPEDIEIYDSAYDKLQKIQILFYASLVMFLPIWVLCSYFSYLWGPRQLAFAAYFPMDDPMDDRFYIPALAEEALAGFYIVVVVIEAELAMFSIMLQIEACYQILSKNIQKLDEIYGDDYEKRNECVLIKPKQEVNGYLKRETAKQLIKTLIIRQLEIVKFMKDFEEIYSPCMLLQLTAGSILLVMNGVELSMYVEDMAAKFFFQSGYTILILVDVFFVCYLLTRLTTECLNVGTAAYSTPWYNMDTDLRQSIQMIMIRSQSPPRITVGKFATADLSTYLTVLSNTYSWLMLFRQLGSK